MSLLFLSVSEDKNNSPTPTISIKPKKKFLASDLKNMHNILAKNMYKIRQRVRMTHLTSWATVTLVFFYRFFLSFFLS